MPAITITDLNNAKLDVDHIAAIVTSDALTATDRLGNIKKTLAGMNAEINEGAESILALSTAQADNAAESALEALGYLQAYRATSYGALASDPSTDPIGGSPTVGDEYFNTTAGLLKRFNGATWQASDINTANLAASTGSTLIGWISSKVGAVTKTIEKWIGYQSVNLCDFLTLAEIADITSNNVTLDIAVALQKAVDALPLNPAGDGILSPKGFANGGIVRLPKGRMRVGQKINLHRGVRIIGEGREASQIISFTPGTVFQYADAGRYISDEVSLEDFSIWQDPSVVATSGAAFEITAGATSPPSVFITTKNILVEGTYYGLSLAAGIGCKLGGAVQKTVSHGVILPSSGVADLSTSVDISALYSSQSVTGSGFFCKNASYISFNAAASDSNARYGYELEDTSSVSVTGGAEQNSLGGVLLKNTRGTRVFVDVVDNLAASSSAVTLDNAVGTVIGGVHHAGAGATGWSVNVVSPSVGTVAQGLVSTGLWDTTQFCNDASNILVNGRQAAGFLGGIGRRWSFGVAGFPSLVRMFEVGGDADAGVTQGLVVSAAHRTVGGVNSQVTSQAATYPSVVTYTVLNGIYVPNAIKGAGSSIARSNGVYVEEQTQGSNANANISFATASPAVGNWNIYSASTRDNVWLGKQRYLSSTGPTQSFGAGSPEGSVTAPVGSQYGRTDGGAGTSLYIKESGSGNTGWAAK